MLKAWLIAVAPGAVYFLLIFAYLRGLRERRDRAIALALPAQSNYEQVYRLSGRERDAGHDVMNKLAELRVFPYHFPVVLTFVLMTALTAVSLVKAAFDLGVGEWNTQIQRVSGYALAGGWGGYVWGLYDCLRRFRIRTWTANSQYFIWFRIVLGTSLGGILVVPFTDSYAPLVAFGLGTFPAETLLKIVQGMVSDKIKYSGQPEIEVRPPWRTIEGLTQETIDRLREADVTSPCHLAYSEPVALNSRTNIEWRAMIDMIDQALLAIYVEEKIDALRRMGIRGSIELAILWVRLNSSDAQTSTDARATITAVAAALGCGESEARNLIRNLFEDSQVKLIWELYFKDE